jgi:hypothetical protein
MSGRTDWGSGAAAEPSAQQDAQEERSRHAREQLLPVLENDETGSLRPDLDDTDRAGRDAASKTST